VAATQLGAFLQIIAPKKKTKAGGTAVTESYNPSAADRVLTVPVYKDHLTDIFASRQADDSRTLLKSLFKNDPDVSAAVNSYLTLANTPMRVIVRDLEGEIDRDATRELGKAVKALTAPTDYTLGFMLKKDLSSICEEMRYMLLLRGAIGNELVLGKKLEPVELRNVDMANIEWYEKQPGLYKPVQKKAGVEKEISLDLPTFFVSFFRRDPTSIYSDSFFVSAINTIAARQQVVNDLYRIMQKTGYPRMDIKVVEEVLMKNAPANVKTDKNALITWTDQQLARIRQQFEGVRADQAFLHFDSVEPRIINEKNPGIGIDVSSVIETLNAQNQAGLKTMATVIGRGTSGVNTGSVEARIAAMNADELNEPVAEVLGRAFSFMLHQSGYQGFCEVSFSKAELRPDTELEPQLALRAARLRTDLSLGLITDDEYHLMMHNRLRPDSAPELSGTNFEAGSDVGNAENASPNGDPLGRSLTGEGSAQKAAKGNAAKPKAKAKPKGTSA
jgi:hypothetical protein